MDTDTMQDRLAAHPFLEGFPAAWLEPMSHLASRSARHAGARLFHEGTPARRFWLIVDGLVALDATVPGGEVIVDTLGPGAVLGWSWLFAPHRWHFGAVAVVETQTIEFDAVGVLRLCEQDPALGHELSRRFLGVLFDRLQATRSRLVADAGRPDSTGPSRQ